jgi:hypothetical protein
VLKKGYFCLLKIVNSLFAYVKKSIILLKDKGFYIIPKSV